MKLFSENNVKLIELLRINEAFPDREYCWYKRQQNRILVPVSTTIYNFILYIFAFMTARFGYSTIFRSPLESSAYTENSQSLGLTTCAIICDSIYTYILETYITQLKQESFKIYKLILFQLPTIYFL
jgi:hypothetical protein